MTDLIAPIIAYWYVIWYSLNYPQPVPFASDFRIYLRAAGGDFDTRDAYPGDYGWLYNDWLAVLWRPFLLIPRECAETLWFAIVAVSYFVFCVLITKGVPYGWILVLASAKIVAPSVRLGNVTPILGLASLTPVGAAVACFFKPHLFPLVLAHIFAPEIRGFLAETPASGSVLAGIGAAGFVSAPWWAVDGDRILDVVRAGRARVLGERGGRAEGHPVDPRLDPRDQPMGTGGLT